MGALLRRFQLVDHHLGDLLRLPDAAPHDPGAAHQAGIDSRGFFGLIGTAHAPHEPLRIRRLKLRVDAAGAASLDRARDPPCRADVEPCGDGCRGAHLRQQPRFVHSGHWHIPHDLAHEQHHAADSLHLPGSDDCDVVVPLPSLGACLRWWPPQHVQLDPPVGPNLAGLPGAVLDRAGGVVVLRLQSAQSAHAVMEHLVLACICGHRSTRELAASRLLVLHRDRRRAVATGQHRLQAYRHFLGHGAFVPRSRWAWSGKCAAGSDLDRCRLPLVLVHPLDANLCGCGKFALQPAVPLGDVDHGVAFRIRHLVALQVSRPRSPSLGAHLGVDLPLLLQLPHSSTLGRGQR
mmetsp:Transcript_79449/g.257289  ORF Transcript_79449/g.257289 Transcript_79449/m.257289 type:complete len:348 (-) Transcript_79449:2426-3469(-)